MDLLVNRNIEEERKVLLDLYDPFMETDNFLSLIENKFIIKDSHTANQVEIESLNESLDGTCGIEFPNDFNLNKYNSNGNCIRFKLNDDLLALTNETGCYNPLKIKMTKVGDEEDFFLVSVVFGDKQENDEIFYSTRDVAVIHGDSLRSLFNDMVRDESLIVGV